VTASTKAVGN